MMIFSHLPFCGRNLCTGSLLIGGKLAIALAFAANEMTAVGPRLNFPSVHDLSKYRTQHFGKWLLFYQLCEASGNNICLHLCSVYPSGWVYLRVFNVFFLPLTADPFTPECIEIMEQLTSLMCKKPQTLLTLSLLLSRSFPLRALHHLCRFTKPQILFVPNIALCQGKWLNICTKPWNSLDFGFLCADSAFPSALCSTQRVCRVSRSPAQTTGCQEAVRILFYFSIWESSFFSKCEALPVSPSAWKWIHFVVTRQHVHQHNLWCSIGAFKGFFFPTHLKSGRRDDES